MALVELSAAAFVLFNAVKLAGYVPQFLKIYRDCNGAAAVSLGTWLIFTASNAATAAYAVIHAGDWVIAGVFSVNAVSCLLIAGLTLIKRRGGPRRSDSLKSQSELAHIGGARSPAMSLRQ